MTLGWVLKRAFKFLAWIISAICFNNTTAHPLLLVQSLDAAGIISDFTMGEGHSTSAAAERAKSYFLISTMIGNSLSFAVGLKLLGNEESLDKKDKDGRDQHSQNGINGDME